MQNLENLSTDELEKIVEELEWHILELKGTVFDEDGEIIKITKGYRILVDSWGWEKHTDDDEDKHLAIRNMMKKILSNRHEYYNPIKPLTDSPTYRKFLEREDGTDRRNS